MLYYDIKFVIPLVARGPNAFLSLCPIFYRLYKANRRTHRVQPTAAHTNYAMTYLLQCIVESSGLDQRHFDCTSRAHNGV
ncbi:hypothetical protein PROFUN_15764 [Planoprotostelium fungivorum]|uniref:Uncharacterized protein n=1 Tax=Planoprotostelium fungivorum TaxID=1890364 RepID=A0A2P6MZS0_9EUKA|nr:hypothetical protein PROFUN_15764 [Planoprotostelium fungivorum]